VKHIYRFIVKFRKIVIIVFLLVSALSAFAWTQVKVDYDMNNQLPKDSPSTISIDVMNEEFDNGIPNLRVMVKNVSIPEALEYKTRFEEIDGISDVMWLDDSVSLKVPLSSIDSDVLETYYQDGNALFSMVVEDDKRVEAVDAVRKVVGEENAVSGAAALTAYATTSTLEEVKLLIIFAVSFVILVLLLTTDSWFEPVIIMVSLGMAIVINAGTNLIFGTISFVTNAAGNILQLAVSLDYSVFLIHRFEESRLEFANPENAMVDALCKSTTSILSSGLTTVIGFVALCFMRFLIGPDMGMALAKGVAISLITTFTLTPCLVMETYSILDKTRHKQILPKFDKFANFITKIMIPMVVVFALICIPAFLGSNANAYYYGAQYLFGDDVKITQDTNRINEVFGKRDTYVLLVPRGDKVTEKDLSNALREIDKVTDIISYVDTVGSEIPESYLDPDTLVLLESENYSRMVISVEADYESEKTFELVETVRNTVSKYYDEYYLAGQGVSTYDLMDTITADMVKVNLIAIGAVLVVLMILTKNIILPFILVLCIEGAIWINMSIPYFEGNHVFYIAYLIVSSIQLGATVDYAILLSERYREFRQEMDKLDSVKATLSTSTLSVMTSGIVLAFVGIVMGIVSSNKLLGQMGTLIGVGALLSLGAVLLVLPGLLYICDGLFIGKKVRAHEKA